MSRAELEHALWAILDALREYTDDIVLVGGWVPYLHLAYGRAADETVRTSLTAEADLMLPRDLRRGERRPIALILQEAGFQRAGHTGVVWAREPERGETIEFLRSHRGTADSRGLAASVPEQPELRALSLEGLWILEAFTEPLLFPDPTEEGAPVTVRVPTLAAFIVNKANTFNLRGGPDREMKAGKDLLYLRDIMAAGEHAQDVTDGDLKAMLTSDLSDRASDALNQGVYHLRHVAQRFCPAAGEILAEREGLGSTDAEADVLGHLTDLVDFLQRRCGN